MTGTSLKNTEVRLDALFDYSKVRPLPIPLDDDDDDEDVQIITPPQKTASGRLRTSTELGTEIVPVKDDEAVKVVDDFDWLAPPSTTPVSQRMLPADPTLLRIRQQKQELETIWQASLKNIEEASRLEARETEAASQKQPESDKREHDDDDGSEEAPNKRQRILLKLQEESGECHGARIYVDEKLDKLFTYYANKFGNRPKTDFVFRFDGQPLNANSSPKDLDLEDEDIVEVCVKGARR